MHIDPVKHTLIITTMSFIESYACRWRDVEGEDGQNHQTFNTILAISSFLEWTKTHLKRLLLEIAYKEVSHKKGETAKNETLFRWDPSPSLSLQLA